MFGGEAATCTGREEIAAFYEYRIKRGIARVVVHSVTNFRVSFEGRDRAISTWYLLSFAADGEPVRPTHPPIIIALISDTQPTNLKVDAK